MKAILRVYEEIKNAPATSAIVADMLDMSLASASAHLSVLYEDGLIDRKPQVSGKQGPQEFLYFIIQRRSPAAEQKDKEGK